MNNFCILDTCVNKNEMWLMVEMLIMQTWQGVFGFKRDQGNRWSLVAEACQNRLSNENRDIISDPKTVHKSEKRPSCPYLKCKQKQEA